MSAPLLYTGMVDAANSELIASGIDAEQAASIAERIAETFCIQQGGLICRVPQLKNKIKRRRDAELIEDFKVMSVDALAKKYDLSRTQVYEITQTKSTETS